MIEDPDLSIIDNVLAGQVKQYAELVNRYKSYVYTIALKVLQDKPEAEEAAQDCFIKAYHGLKGFNRQSKFSTWLYRIAFNTAISYKRKQRQKLQSIDNLRVEYDQKAEGMLEIIDKQKFIQQAMNKLNEADRTALTLFYLQELSLEEIGAITNMPSNTVKVKIHRARLKMAEELKNILNQEALTL